MSIWNDIFDASTDWSAVTFLNMFVDAINERVAALGFGSVEQLASVSVGTDVQTSVGFAGAFSIANLQGWVGANITGFGDINIPIDTTTPPTSDAACRYTITAFLAAAGLSSGAGSALWTRKRPREIASVTATVDHQGNAASTAQLAWVDGLADIYVCVTSGHWFLAPAGSKVDILDSDDGDLPYGQMEAGDYIGPHLFNQLRDAINVMTRIPWNTTTLSAVAVRQNSVTPHAGFCSLPMYTYTAGSSGTGPTWLPDAVGDLAANWPTVQNFTDSGAIVIYEGSVGIVFPSDIHYDATAGDVNWSMGGYRPFEDIPLTFSPKVYYVGNFDSSVTGGTFDPNGVTDSFGSLIVIGACLMGIQTVNQASMPVTASSYLAYPLVGNFGDISGPPNTCPSPAPLAPTFSGYRIFDTYMVEDYDVGGGFAFTAHT